MLLFFVEGARIRKEYDESSSRLSKIQSRISSLTEKLKHDIGKYDMLRFCFDLMKSDGSEYHKLGCLFFTLIFFWIWPFSLQHFLIHIIAKYAMQAGIYFSKFLFYSDL